MSLTLSKISGGQPSGLSNGDVPQQPKGPVNRDSISSAGQNESVSSCGRGLRALLNSLKKWIFEHLLCWCKKKEKISSSESSDNSEGVEDAVREFSEYRQKKMAVQSRNLKESEKLQELFQQNADDETVLSFIGKMTIPKTVKEDRVEDYKANRVSFIKKSRFFFNYERQAFESLEISCFHNFMTKAKRSGAQAGAVFKLLTQESRNQLLAVFKRVNDQSLREADLCKLISQDPYQDTIKKMIDQIFTDARNLVEKFREDLIGLSF